MLGSKNHRFYSIASHLAIRRRGVKNRYLPLFSFNCQSGGGREKRKNLFEEIEGKKEKKQDSRVKIHLSPLNSHYPRSTEEKVRLPVHPISVSHRDLSDLSPISHASNRWKSPVGHVLSTATHLLIVSSSFHARNRWSRPKAKPSRFFIREYFRARSIIASFFLSITPPTRKFYFPFSR